METLGNPEEHPTLKCEDKAVSDLRASLGAAYEEGKSTGYYNVVFHVAQFLSGLVDPLGYKVVLVRKDVEPVKLTPEPSSSTEPVVKPRKAAKKASPRKVPTKKTATKKPGTRNVGKIAVKATTAKATGKLLPLSTKLRDLPGIKPRILDMLSLKDKHTIGDVVELSTVSLRVLDRVGPQAVKSLDDALAAAGYSRPRD